MMFYNTERTSPILGDKQFVESALIHIGEFDAEVLLANRRMVKHTIGELVSEVAIYFDTKIEFLTQSAKDGGSLRKVDNLKKEELIELFERKKHDCSQCSEGLDVEFYCLWKASRSELRLD